MELAGRSALVIGAGSGVRRGVAQALAAAGMQVCDDQRTGREHFFAFTTAWSNLAAARGVRWAGGSARLGMVSLVAQGAGLMLLAFAPQFWQAAALLWFTFWVRNLFVSPHAALYNAEVPDAQRSVTLSVMSVAFFLGVTAGNTAVGFVTARVGLSAGWTGVGMLVMLSAGALWPLLKGETEREVPSPQP